MNIKDFKYIAAVLSMLLLQACVTQPASFEGKQIVKPKYKITLSDDKQAIFVAGEFDLGLYHNVLKIYKPNRSTVQVLIYQSHGGYLKESDRLFRLASKNNLDTYALKFCSSACAAAFLGGKNRFAAHRTRIGFHQYGTSTPGGFPGGVNTKLIARQYKDAYKFNKQGVDKEFTDKIFKTKHSSMWRPSAKELIKAKVVHEFVDRKKFPSFNTFDKSLYPDS